MANRTSLVLKAQRRSRAKRDMRYQIFGVARSIEAGDPFVLSADANSETGDKGNYFSKITFATSIKVTGDNPSGTVFSLGDSSNMMKLSFVADKLQYEIGESGTSSHVIGNIAQVENGYDGDIVVAILPFYSNYNIATETRDATIAWVKIYGRNNRLFVSHKSAAPMTAGWSMESPGVFADELNDVEVNSALWVFEDTLPKNFYGNQSIYSNVPKTSPSDPNKNDGHASFDDGFSDGFDTEEMTNG